MSTQEAEYLQRSEVISELKETSFTSQQNVQAYLKHEAEYGDAEIVQSYFIVNGMAVTATEEVMKEIATFSEVEKILPNEKRELKATTKQTSEMNQDKARVAWNIDHIRAPKAWDMDIDGTGTVVASIGTGVQWDHPALKEKYRGYDANTGEVNHDFNWMDFTAGKNVPYDDVGDDTHTMGTMVGSDPDGYRQIGVAPGATFITAKAFIDDGGYDTDIIAASEWLMAPTDKEGNERVDLAPDIVNNSWGGGRGFNEWYREVVKRWTQAKIFPVFAVGDKGLTETGPGSAENPANYPESFAVGATDQNDKLAYFSAQGPSPYDEIKPDISAPGVGIVSSVPGDDYEMKAGTNHAAPLVAGVAALLLQADANLEVDELKEILHTTTKPLTDDDFTDTPNNGYGYGLVDAENTVLAAQNGIGTLEGTVSLADEESNDSQIDNDVMQSLPEAEVTILDSGRTVKADPEDGSYSLQYAAGTYTVSADAYGYATKKSTIEIKKGEPVEANFELPKLSKVTVGGTVTDKVSGKLVEEAKVSLVEDANTESVETDAHGNYSLTAYEGEYTLKVMAKGYRISETKITIEEGANWDIILEPIYAYPGDEIAYDDGSAETSISYEAAGDGLAVKVSLPEDKDSAVLTEGLFKFWEEKYPNPNGATFKAEVWDASGPNGLPGKKLAGPIDADAIIDKDEWSVVDFGGENIIVEDDFYMVYVQDPGTVLGAELSTDTSSPNASKSYKLNGGFWDQSPEEDGNYMIRAKLDYEVGAPSITSPKDGMITNHSKVEIAGEASPTTSVKVTNNGNEVDEIAIDHDGTFTMDGVLTEGENTLLAETIVDGNVIFESEPVTVILDTEKPELTIDNPKSGDKTNRNAITVDGTVSDANSVTVNGQKTDVNDGTYSKRVMIEKGKNKIKVVAKDSAGNKVTKIVTVTAKYSEPKLENLTPTEDKELQAGDSVKIEFDSEPGLETTFYIRMPLTNTIAQIANATELPIMEMADGHYVGYWTAPSNVVAEGAVIEVKAVDDYGNETRKKTNGKLFINVGDE